jgi:hypothetical protein
MSTGEILLDLPPQDYYRRELDVVSNSTLKIADQQSLAHYYHYCTAAPEDDETPAKLFGKAYHSAILEPETFESRYMVLPPDAPRRPSRAQINAKKPSAATLDAIDFWASVTASGKTLLPADDFDTIRFMADALHRDPVCAGLVTGGRREVSLRWVEDVHMPDGSVFQLHHKGRVDNWLDDMDIAVDPKSCLSAHPDAFARAATTMRYHQQHAQYCSGFQHCGRPLKGFVFLAQEKEPPFVCKPYRMNPVFEERGYELRQRAMQKVASALRSGRWPGYVTRDERGNETPIGDLNPPAWALYDSETT